MPSEVGKMSIQERIRAMNEMVDALPLSDSPERNGTFNSQQDYSNNDDADDDDDDHADEEEIPQQPAKRTSVVDMWRKREQKVSEPKSPPAIRKKSVLEKWSSAQQKAVAQETVEEKEEEKKDEQDSPSKLTVVEMIALRSKQQAAATASNTARSVNSNSSASVKNEPVEDDCIDFGQKKQSSAPPAPPPVNMSVADMIAQRSSAMGAAPPSTKPKAVSKVPKMQDKDLVIVDEENNENASRSTISTKSSIADRWNKRGLTCEVPKTPIAEPEQIVEEEEEDLEPQRQSVKNIWSKRASSNTTFSTPRQTPMTTKAPVEEASRNTGNSSTKSKVVNRWDKSGPISHVPFLPASEPESEQNVDEDDEPQRQSVKNIWSTRASSNLPSSTPKTTPMAAEAPVEKASQSTITTKSKVVNRWNKSDLMNEVPHAPVFKPETDQNVEDDVEPQRQSVKNIWSKRASSNVRLSTPRQTTMDAEAPAQEASWNTSSSTQPSVVNRWKKPVVIVETPLATTFEPEVHQNVEQKEDEPERQSVTKEWSKRASSNVRLSTPIQTTMDAEAPAQEASWNTSSSTQPSVVNRWKKPVVIVEAPLAAAFEPEVHQNVEQKEDEPERQSVTKEWSKRASSNVRLSTPIQTTMDAEAPVQEASWNTSSSTQPSVVNRWKKPVVIVEAPLAAAFEPEVHQNVEQKEDEPERQSVTKEWSKRASSNMESYPPRETFLVDEAPVDGLTTQPFDAQEDLPKQNQSTKKWGGHRSPQTSLATKPADSKPAWATKTLKRSSVTTPTSGENKSVNSKPAWAVKSLKTAKSVYQTSSSAVPNHDSKPAWVAKLRNRSTSPAPEANVESQSPLRATWADQEKSRVPAVSSPTPKTAIASPSTDSKPAWMKNVLKRAELPVSVASPRRTVSVPSWAIKRTEALSQCEQLNAVQKRDSPSNPAWVADRAEIMVSPIPNDESNQKGEESPAPTPRRLPALEQSPAWGKRSSSMDSQVNEKRIPVENQVEEKAPVKSSFDVHASNERLTMGRWGTPPSIKVVTVAEPIVAAEANEVGPPSPAMASDVQAINTKARWGKGSASSNRVSAKASRQVNTPDSLNEVEQQAPESDELPAPLINTKPAIPPGAVASELPRGIQTSPSSFNEVEMSKTNLSPVTDTRPQGVKSASSQVSSRVTPPRTKKTLSAHLEQQASEMNAFPFLFSGGNGLSTPLNSESANMQLSPSNEVNQRMPVPLAVSAPAIDTRQGWDRGSTPESSTKSAYTNKESPSWVTSQRKTGPRVTPRIEDDDDAQTSQSESVASSMSDESPKRRLIPSKAANSYEDDVSVARSTSSVTSILKSIRKLKSPKKRSKLAIDMASKDALGSKEIVEAKQDVPGTPVGSTRREITSPVKYTFSHSPGQEAFDPFDSLELAKNDTSSLDWPSDNQVFDVSGSETMEPPTLKKQDGSKSPRPSGTNGIWKITAGTSPLQQKIMPKEGKYGIDKECAAITGTSIGSTSNWKTTSTKNSAFETMRTRQEKETIDQEVAAITSMSRSNQTRGKVQGGSCTPPLIELAMHYKAPRDTATSNTIFRPNHITNGVESHEKLPTDQCIGLRSMSSQSLNSKREENSRTPTPTRFSRRFKLAQTHLNAKPSLTMTTVPSVASSDIETFPPERSSPKIARITVQQKTETRGKAEPTDSMVRLAISNPASSGSDAKAVTSPSNSKLRQSKKEIQLHRSRMKQRRDHRSDDQSITSISSETKTGLLPTSLRASSSIIQDPPEPKRIASVKKNVENRKGSEQGVLTPARTASGVPINPHVKREFKAESKKGSGRSSPFPSSQAIRENVNEITTIARNPSLQPVPNRAVVNSKIFKKTPASSASSIPKHALVSERKIAPDAPSWNPAPNSKPRLVDETKGKRGLSSRNLQQEQKINLGSPSWFPASDPSQDFKNERKVMPESNSRSGSPSLEQKVAVETQNTHESPSWSAATNPQQGIAVEPKAARGAPSWSAPTNLTVDVGSDGSGNEPLKSVFSPFSAFSSRGLNDALSHDSSQSERKTYIPDALQSPRSQNPHLASRLRHMKEREQRKIRTTQSGASDAGQPDFMTYFEAPRPTSPTPSISSSGCSTTSSLADRATRILQIRRGRLAAAKAAKSHVEAPTSSNRVKNANAPFDEGFLPDVAKSIPPTRENISATKSNSSSKKPVNLSVVVDRFGFVNRYNSSERFLDTGTGNTPRGLTPRGEPSSKFGKGNTPRGLTPRGEPASNCGNGHTPRGLTPRTQPTSSFESEPSADVRSLQQSNGSSEEDEDGSELMSIQRNLSMNTESTSGALGIHKQFPSQSSSNMDAMRNAAHNLTVGDLAKDMKEEVAATFNGSVTAIQNMATKVVGTPTASACRRTKKKIPLKFPKATNDDEDVAIEVEYIGDDSEEEDEDDFFDKRALENSMFLLGPPAGQSSYESKD